MMMLCSLSLSPCNASHDIKIKVICQLLVVSNGTDEDGVRGAREDFERSGKGEMRWRHVEARQCEAEKSRDLCLDKRTGLIGQRSWQSRTIRLSIGRIRRIIGKVT